MNKGLLTVISGPSGAGKGTVLKEYFKNYNDSVLSVSATTRSPRQGEENGREYYFVSKEDFESMLEKGEILEHTTYNGNYYGTPAGPIKEKLAEGKNVILEIETDGGMQVKKLFPETVSIFILPPSFEELKHRLVGRGTETPEQVEGRLNTAKNELRLAENYDYVVTNDEVAKAAEKIHAILTAHKCRTENNKKEIYEVQIL